MFEGKSGDEVGESWNERENGGNEDRDRLA